MHGSVVAEVGAVVSRERSGYAHRVPTARLHR